MEGLNSAPKKAADKIADLMVVSAFGRGNWLASELAGRGWKVTLVDVSDAMGPFAPEDVEGPFGLLEAADLAPSQKSRMQEEGDAVALPQGFTFWFGDGPLEMRSEMTALHLAKREIPASVDAYLRRQGLADRDTDRERRALLRRPFREVWLAHLAHQIASPAMCENHEALAHGAHLPLFSPFSIRQVTDSSLQRGLKACQSHGVKVRAHAKVRDIRFNGGSVDAIEIQDERAGVENGRSLVWMLSSQETQQSPPAVGEALFPKGAIEPEWYWARFQFAIEGDMDHDQIPAHAVILDDVFLPWTHLNLLVLRKRRAQPGDLTVDLWAKLPVHFHSDSARLSEFVAGAKQILERRLPRVRAAFIAPERTDSKIRNPIFREETLEKLPLRRAPNLFFCGPEQWEFADWLGQFRPQNQLLAKLTKLKTQWDAADARAAAREVARQGDKSP